MPRSWCYYIALVLPMFFRILVLNTPFVDELWYHEYFTLYDLFNHLRVQPQFLEFIGGWQLFLFISVMFMRWTLEDEDIICKQFLLLPIVYLPFTLVANMARNFDVNPTILYAHPLIILPFGYIYIGIWVMFTWLLTKLRLVVVD